MRPDKMMAALCAAVMTLAGTSGAQPVRTGSIPAKAAQLSDALYPVSYDLAPPEVTVDVFSETSARVSWVYVTGMTAYEYDIAYDRDFTDIRRTNCAYIRSVNLTMVPGMSYYVRVRAVLDDGGGRQYSDYTVVTVVEYGTNTEPPVETTTTETTTSTTPETTTSTTETTTSTTPETTTSTTETTTSTTPETTTSTTETTTSTTPETTTSTTETTTSTTETTTSTTETTTSTTPETTTSTTETTTSTTPETTTSTTETTTSTTPETTTTTPVVTPPNPTTLLGDVNGDQRVDAGDASEVLVAAAKIGAGKTGDLDWSRLWLGDVNHDGSYNATDASMILTYSAYIGAGGNGTLEEYQRR